MVKKNSLGRGLDALLSTDDIRTEGSSSINEVEISMIFPNPDQPRRDFDEDSLSELSTSIKNLGVIQPVSLRMISEGNYQIIAGERRYRAAKLAGLQRIPAYIKTAEDDTVMEMALIENIQREDLNSIEIALAFQKLLEIYNLTQEKLSERLGKKRATIANYLRLLKLPAEIQIGLKNKTIDVGHAKALLGIEDPETLLTIYEDIIKYGYSVRKVEEIVKSLTQPEEVVPVKKEKAKKLKTPEEYMALQRMLSEQLNTNVKFTIGNNGRGSISIPFKSEKQLEILMDHFDKMINN
jgi:ParB family chromosome partitioning protein